jgi:hypothetical protein
MPSRKLRNGAGWRCTPAAREARFPNPFQPVSGKLPHRKRLEERSKLAAERSLLSYLEGTQSEVDSQC